MESIFVNLLGKFGIIPVLFFMIAVVWFLLREIKKEVSGVKASITSLKDDIAKKLDAYQEHSDEMDKKLEAQIHQVGDRLSYIEREYVKREDLYQDLGGWREEIRETNQRIDKVGQNLTGSIQNILGMIAHGR